MLYQCPLCLEPLNQQSHSFRCVNNHQFDIAKEGYVNLIPANKKRSKNPGDNTEMMQARRRFLDGEHYAPLRDRVTTLCHEQLITPSPWHALDIGCGEGYYTNQLATQLKLANQQSAIYGLDISKVAVRYAAKKYRHGHFSVASSQYLPFVDNSLDLILRIYAPCNPDEINRCIKNHGLLVTVTPAKRHLYQLRELIYDQVRLHDEEIETVENFSLEYEERLNYPMKLDSDSALDLLQMTPFAWKATEETRNKLINNTLFTCEADFMIRVYRKNN
ncbi:23S rRNA (guanine(745)-N(1))-methyltransferase [Vibrio sp. MA40-2]|uniref:23S rRNA (guanine(745)-N(1))-methyltransferase n=1 Tax=Vibrio sp. MA40-2 TaxID=3391828 RepID=UPI0039A77F79